MISIGPLQPRDRAAAVDLLTRSFLDDPGMQAVVGHDAARMSRWFAATLDLLAAPARNIVVAHGPEGLCGVLLSAGFVAPDPWRQLRWLGRVAVSVGPAAAWRTIDHDRRRRATMRPGAGIVEFVAVAEAARGQGIASQLFGHCIQPVDHWWLETTRPENLPIFARLGYRETERRREAGVTYHAMERTGP